MNSELCLYCVRCEQNARFLCARCSDAYCSKTCQVMHWPFHRTMCLSMPSLLEIPTSGHLVLPICDTRNNNNPAIAYPSWDARQYNISPRNHRKTNNYEKSICSGGVPPFKQIQGRKTYPRDHNTVHAKKSDQVLETQERTSKESIISTESIPFREGTQQSGYKHSQKFGQPTKYEVQKAENSNAFSKNETSHTSIEQLKLNEPILGFQEMPNHSQNCDKSALEMPQLTNMESRKSGKFIPLQENQTQRPQNLDEPIDLQEVRNKKSHESENSFPIKTGIQKSMAKVSAKQDHQRLELPKLTKTESQKSGHMPLQENGAQRLRQIESLDWDEEPTFGLKDPLIWQKPFSLPKHNVEVIVQYFVESPSKCCWVLQSQHVKERDNLLAEAKKLHYNVNAVGEHDIKINEVYCVQRADIYHRGVVVYQINSKEVVVRLIDEGRSFQAHISTLKILNPHLKFKNAYALEINLETSLELHAGQILKIHEFSIDAVGAINVQLSEGEKGISSLPVPLGVPMDLFCLDYSNIEMGYISACKNDAQKIESINNLSDKINQYIWKFQKDEKYLPKLDELCLVYHGEEKQWYRGECIKIINSSCVEVLFIDFGNTKIVNSSDVRKMASLFMEPAIMHFFRIYGVPQRPSRDLINKITCFFDDNPIFSITRVEKFDDMQVIHCQDLLNVIHYRFLPD